MEENKLEMVAEPFRTHLSSLITRCEKAEIQYELKLLAEKVYFLIINLPSGRETRNVYVFDQDDDKKLSQIEFEKYVFIPRYEATCSYEYGFIEAYVKLFRPIRIETVFSRLLNLDYREARKLKKEDFTFSVKHAFQNENQILITLSQPTNTMLALTNRELDDGSGLTIKINGLKLTNSKEAIDIIEKLANSFFFEIRNSTGIPLMLELYEEPWIFPKLPIFFPEKSKETIISFPKYQYDLEPLNLYWYATSAYEMPLLQFLAYYQVLEFYFPIYSGKEVQSEVANILKDPQFNPDHHLDINKVISAVITKMGRGYGDERSQVRATIKGCVQDKEVRELMERDDIKEHFKKDFNKLSKIKVSIDNKDIDLREQLAERIYDIRCRVVHTKANETERERILPYTEEEALLTVEIKIIEFLARKALIAGSKKLSL